MGSLKNGGHWWLLVCCFLVLVVHIECDENDAAAQLECTYTVTVETSCPKEAATTHPVYIRFGDKGGNDVVIRPLNSKFSRRILPFQLVTFNNDSSTKPFQACTIDEYQVTDVCIESKICYVYFKLMDEKDSWRVGSVQVLVSEDKLNHLSSQRYNIRAYLPPKSWHGVDQCDSETAAKKFGMKKKRRIFFNKKKIR